MEFMLSHDEIWEILTSELSRARARYQRAQAAYDSVLAETSGPSTDLAQRIRGAESRMTSAREALKEAFQRYNDFTSAGAAPKDLGRQN